ncbi:MAG: sel1 repeat family protein [Rhodospirillales bacterium]|nr:MAG: sel1 repeat family protein [Rhodospirillales bacterium]
MRAEVLPKPELPGHAVLRVHGLDAGADGLTICIERRQGPEKYLSDGGWQRSETWLAPERIEGFEGGIDFHVGPVVCDMVAGMTARLSIREPGIGTVGATVVAWPAMQTSGAYDPNRILTDDSAAGTGRSFGTGSAPTIVANLKAAPALPSILQAPPEPDPPPPPLQMEPPPPFQPPPFQPPPFQPPPFQPPPQAEPPPAFAPDPPPMFAPQAEPPPPFGMDSPFDRPTTVSTPEPRPAPPPKKSGGAGIWIALAAVLVLLIGGGGGAYWWFFMREEPVVIVDPNKPDPNKGGPQTADYTTPIRKQVEDFLKTNPTPAQIVEKGRAFLKAGQLEGAFLVWRHGAETGDPVAAAELGGFYDPVNPIANSPFPPSAERAAQWYERAAKVELPAAMRKLGMLYAKGGEGFPADKSKARDWLTKAADKGDAEAKRALAEL